MVMYKMIALFLKRLVVVVVVSHLFKGLEW
jgi:hypothetical protein